MLQRHRIPYSVVHEDLGPVIEAVSINRDDKPSQFNFDFSIYHTLPEVSDK